MVARRRTAATPRRRRTTNAQWRTVNKKREKPWFTGGFIEMAGVLAAVDEATKGGLADKRVFGWIPGASIAREVSIRVRNQFGPMLSSIPAGIPRAMVYAGSAKLIHHTANKKHMNPHIVHIPGVLSLRFF